MAVRQGRRISDEEMERLVRARLDMLTRRPPKAPGGSFWMEHVDHTLPRLLHDDARVVIKRMPFLTLGAQGLKNRPAWRTLVVPRSEAPPASEECLVLDKAGYKAWVEDRMRTSPPEWDPPSKNEEIHLRRWLAVIEARKEGLKCKPKKSWKTVFKEVSKRLQGEFSGRPSTIKRSYMAVQRTRRAFETGSTSKGLDVSPDAHANVAAIGLTEGESANVTRSIQSQGKLH